MKKHFVKTVKITLVLVYFVIVAGAVVRMTGSGMGCPDWPKCFGYYIPPTEQVQLEWQADKEYKKGQVIIVNESLKVAKASFKTSSAYSAEKWENYTKHDYAVFNAFHTWTEFINRLIGAIAGLATLLMAIVSFWYWKERKVITILSWLTVFGMGFQGWLGATVVYSVLEPVKITIHMVMALIIVALILYILFLTKKNNENHIKNSSFNLLMIFALALTLIQIILGTQVRQFVDEQIDLAGDASKNLWLSNPNIQFYIHRTFSVIVLLLNVFLFWKNQTKKLGFNKINWVLALIGIEVISGIAMYYMDFPFGTQPIHLVVASILFGFQFYLVLETKKPSKIN